MEWLAKLDTSLIWEARCFGFVVVGVPLYFIYEPAGFVTGGIAVLAIMIMIRLSVGIKIRGEGSMHLMSQLSQRQQLRGHAVDAAVHRVHFHSQDPATKEADGRSGTQLPVDVSLV